MEVKWGHLCTDAIWMDAGVNLMNVIYQFGTDPGKPPALPSPTHLAVRVVATEEEARAELLQAVLTDEKDQAVGPPLVVPITYRDLGPGYPRLGGGKIRLDSWPNLPSVGSYSFDFGFDFSPGWKPLGRASMTIIPRQGKTVRPKIHDPAPVRLAWSHFMVDYQQGPGGLGSLVGVHEYLIYPLGERVNLKDTLLLLQIEADLTVNFSRQLQVDLLDSTGQTAKDQSGRALMPVFRRPITLRRPSNQIDMLVSTATVRFQNDLLLPHGRYHFTFQLDGQPFGKPLDITVLPPAP